MKLKTELPPCLTCTMIAAPKQIEKGARGKLSGSRTISAAEPLPIYNEDVETKLCSECLRHQPQSTRWHKAFDAAPFIVSIGRERGELVAREAST